MKTDIIDKTAENIERVDKALGPIVCWIGSILTYQFFIAGLLALFIHISFIVLLGIGLIPAFILCRKDQNLRRLC